MVSGTYRFRLNVTDDQGANGSDEMIVSVNEEIVNQLPTADAGEDVTIQAPLSSVTLFGQGSDPDGTILVYLWTQTAGNPADITDPSKPSVEINNLLPGIYKFNLEVTDEDGASDNDLITVTVLEEAANLAPTANAGADVTITLPTNSVVLDGSGSDTDGSIDAYSWSIASGPSSINIVEPSNPKSQVTDLTEGIYTLRLRVTDTDGATDEDLMRIIVESEEVNTPPTALAGDDITLKLPVNKATLYGSGFDSDGTITAYLWSMVSGPSEPELSSTNASTLQMNNLIEGTYVMRLRVEDDGGAVATDEVSIIVLPETANEAPFVDAGNDQVVYLPDNQITLTGEAFDPDGTVASVRWSKLSGPGANLINPDALETRVEGLQEGIYFFRITATDDAGAISTDGLRVTVQAEDVNQAPTAIAGPDIDIELPENSVTILGEASDPDNNIASIIWDQTDGPSAIQIENATSLNPSFNMLQEGIYTFRLTVTDTDGLSDSDRMRITVSDISTTAPTIYAGDDIEIYIPSQEALLNAEISDDGYLDTLYWEQVSGERAFISNPNNPRTLIQGLALGSYTFRITGIDNDGLSGSDEVVIRVLSDNSESSYPMKVFTPNGDGDNELWILDPDVQRYSNCPIKIFNRSGQIVFETQSYLNSWDGTWNGQSVREGVYYFILSCPEDSQ
jgi:gliding motility-associated-like protein